MPHSSNISSPHYYLYSEVAGSRESGRWRFVLRASEGSHHLEAGDVEQETSADRLELLAVVRGLEALGQPSRVTLLTGSTYVREGIRYGLAEWSQHDWQWEFFGQMIPVKNADLWRRVDHALAYHQVDCRRWRIDGDHSPLEEGGRRPLPANRRSGRPNSRPRGSQKAVPFKRRSRQVWEEVRSKPTPKPWWDVVRYRIVEFGRRVRWQLARRWGLLVSRPRFE